MNTNDDSTKIIKAEAHDLNTGKIYELTEKPNSDCHFFEPIEHNGKHIIFRIDWKPNDKTFTWEPVLDANIYQKLPLNKDNKLPNITIQHHTARAYDSSTGYYVYDFTFENLNLKLTLKKSVSITFVEKQVLKDSITIHKNGKLIYTDDEKLNKMNTEKEEVIDFHIVQNYAAEEFFALPIQKWNSDQIKCFLKEINSFRLSRDFKENKYSELADKELFLPIFSEIHFHNILERASLEPKFISTNKNRTPDIKDKNNETYEVTLIRIKKKAWEDILEFTDKIKKMVESKSLVCSYEFCSFSKSELDPQKILKKLERKLENISRGEIKTVHGKFGYILIAKQLINFRQASPSYTVRPVKFILDKVEEKEEQLKTCTNFVIYYDFFFGDIGVKKIDPVRFSKLAKYLKETLKQRFPNLKKLIFITFLITNNSFNDEFYSLEQIRDSEYMNYCKITISL
ncbi:Uncharacterised protein [uncultured archaeon]|nr:Uncharacterised protein [uncultured archaeon]